MNLNHNMAERWKTNSITIAKRLGYDGLILEFLNNNVTIQLKDQKVPWMFWYGYVEYSPTNPIIFIYNHNMSCESNKEIIEEFRLKGIPESTLRKVALLLRVIPRKILFEAFNQSGMDHELIGHVYNQLKGNDHSERAAVNVQLEFAKARSGWMIHKWHWKLISLLAPIILEHHKKDQF